MSLQAARSLSAHPLPPLSRLVLGFAMTFVTWQLRQRMRRDMGRLPPHLLSDVGIDPWTAETEADKPFWRA